MPSGPAPIIGSGTPVRGGGVAGKPEEILELVESAFAAAVQWLKLMLEFTGAALVGLGTLSSLIHLARSLRAPGMVRFTPVRLLFARYLSLALEFQLGADILSTTIAPSWEEIGKLGAIAVIRTALNYFLSREMEEEQKTTASEESVTADAKKTLPAPEAG